MAALIAQPVPDLERTPLPLPPARIVQGARHPMGPVRLPPDPFSLLDVPSDACYASEESVEIARSMSILIGGAPVLDQHLESLAVAPTNDMRALARSNCAILFADAFLAAADSDEANRRRRGPLHPEARRAYAEFDAIASSVFGLYDHEIHALIFTPAALPINHERVTLHEVGHALTVRPAYSMAHLRSDLLRGLPAPIEHFLRAYPRGLDPAAVRARVLEALAEAYAWMVVGRWSELPLPLQDGLHALLTGADIRPVI